jgi:hypothetical protein
MNSLEDTVREGAEFVKKEFGLEINTDILQYYSDEDWNKFCQVNNFNPASEGIYVPEGKAYVRDSPYIESNIFHELYGHALFCEYSIPGKLFVEKQRQGVGKDFLKRESETAYNITGRNLTDYEGFAMWMESTICNETGKADVWEKKKKNMPEQYLELWEYFMSAENKLTRYGLMSQMGFPKVYDPKKTVDCVKSIYGKDFENIEMIIAYGSKKPTSDIDLFIVSKNRCGELYNGWLDIYELDKKRFEFMMERLDISVTDPIFTGELIYGNLEQHQDIKNIISNIPITAEAINYNNDMAESQLDFSKKAKDPRHKLICENYNKSYLFNSMSLSQGIALLTLNNIEKQYELYKHTI